MSEEEKIIIEVDESEFESLKEAKPTVRILSFRLGSEHYGIPITDAKEVFKPGLITRVPNTPQFVTGITNLHGEIVPLIDIRYFLGLSAKEGLGGTKAIVTDIKQNPIGLIVDDVDEACDIELESIQPPLATIKGRLAEFTKGEVQLEKEILVLIDLKKILNCEEIENLNRGKI